MMSTENKPPIQEVEDQPEALFEHYKIVVDPGQSPIRIDKFLMNRIESTTRNRIQNGIKLGYVLVNGKDVKSNFKVKHGHTITVSLPKPPKEGAATLAQDIPLDIRYEDDTLMVIHKPAGLVVHPGVGNPTGTLVNGLAFYFKDLDLPNLDENFKNRPGLVHRIDKDTTGLMVIPKTANAMSHLANQFFEHTVERTYQALVWSEPADDKGTIEANIGRHNRSATKQMVYEEGEGGKRAITHYTVLERLYYVSLIECRLETGRTHQIRVHMKHLGHPLFNDERYDGHRIRKGTVYSKYKQFVHNCFKLLPRQALHAKTLGFEHPETGERMSFDSELPQDFQDCLNKWQNYIAGKKTVS